MSREALATSYLLTVLLGQTPRAANDNSYRLERSAGWTEGKFMVQSYRGGPLKP